MTYKIIEDYLTPNKYSRPQLPIRQIKGIVIHWVSNPNTSAKGNRDFFESRKGGLKSFGSAHEIIDLDGDVHICIPKNELAYQVGSDLPYQSGSKQVYTPIAWERLNTNLPRNVKPYPNSCTYGIEATHIDWDGKMTTETYNTLVERCADLCIEFKLNPLMDIYTHQEVVGWKNCHKWFVDNPREWKLFKEKVKREIENKQSPPKQSTKPSTTIPKPTKTLPTITKERIYAENGVLKRCDGNYKIAATDVRHIKFETGKVKYKFVYEKGAKVSSLVKKYGADFGFNAPFFHNGIPLGDTEDDDKVINAAYGKMLKWHEFAVVDGKPIIGQLDKNDNQDFLVQGAPLLVESGQLVYEKYRVEQEVNDDIGKSRCQRTFVWIDGNGDLHLGIADGRVPNSDQGLTLQEMALFAKSHGAVISLGFDGGGSTILADQSGGLNQKLNTGENERVVHHAILVFVEKDKEPKNEITDKEFDDLDKIKVELKDGEKNQLIDAFLSEGTTYVELRKIAQFLGAQVGWDQENKRASVEK